MNDVIEKISLGIFVVVVTIGLIAGVGLAIAWPIKWTWNVVMPYLFGLPVITWGKAWCLYFLAGCLIKTSQTNTTKKG